MRQVRLLVRGALAALSAAVMLAVWPAIAFADGIMIGPLAGEFTPFGDNVWYYVGPGILVVVVMLLGILGLRQMSRRNRPQRVDPAPPDGEE